MLQNKGENYDWSEKQQGFLLGAFYIGYVLTHIPGGIASDYLGAKHVFGGGVLVSALLSLLSPISAHLHYYVFCILRLILGGAQVRISILVNTWKFLF